MTMGDEIKLSDVRPEVAAFAIAMERKLRANDHKGGWKADRPTALMARVAEEFEELEDEVRANTNADGSPREPERMTTTRRHGVLSEAADVANMVMMVADVLGCLDVR